MKQKLGLCSETFAVAALIAAKLCFDFSDCLSGSPVVEEGGERPESGPGRADQARE